jgi:hypothetical protein
MLEWVYCTEELLRNLHSNCHYLLSQIYFIEISFDLPRAISMGGSSSMELKVAGA